MPDPNLSPQRRLAPFHFLLATFLVLSATLHGEEDPGVSAEDPVVGPELEDLDFGLEDFELILPRWDNSLNLRAGLGYKDNVLFSHSDREGSLFFVSALELFAFAPSLRGNQISLFGTFEDIRFFSAEGVDKEQTGLFVGQVKRDLGEDWKAGLSLQYLYQDQVLDLIVLAGPAGPGEATILKIVGHRFVARPSIRWDFQRPYWMELEGGINRQLLGDSWSDYWENGPKMTFGRDFGKRAEVTFSYEYLYSPFDDRSQATRDGFTLPGTRLVMHRHRVELGWRQYWDTNRHWRTTTRLSFDHNDDNGSGYYDYQRYGIAEQLRYAAGRWEFKAQARLAYYEYPRQSISDTDLSKRRRTSLRLNVRGERKLGKRARIFAEADHERSISRLAFDDYHVNTVFSGVDWEF
jgi:hypothetical protein